MKSPIRILQTGFLGLCALGWAAAGEPAPAAPPALLPVERPDSTSALKNVFSPDPAVPFLARRNELDELSNQRMLDSCARALRWLVRQREVDERLKNEALLTLGVWNPDWLSDDLIGMLNDPSQTGTWHAACVRHLCMHYGTYRDQASLNALDAATRSQDPAIYNAAVLEYPRMARDLVWHRNEPGRMAELRRLVARALADERPDTVSSALGAVEGAEFTELVAEVERVASDARRPKEIRAQALRTLSLVARPETLELLQNLQSSPVPELAQAARESIPAAWIAHLRLPELAARQKAFQALSELGESARQALERALPREGPAEAVVEGAPPPTLELLRSLLGTIQIRAHPLPALDRTGLTPLGEDAKNNKPGVAGLRLNAERRLIEVDGEFPLEAGALEYAVVCNGKDAKLHETVVALNCAPLDVCYALLACNYTYAGELHAGGRVNLPPGAGVMLSVEFERESWIPSGKQKETVRVPIDLLIWNSRAGRPMKHSPWAFTGSRVQPVPNGRDVLMVVVEKSIAAIIDDPNALLNTPLDSSAAANINPESQAYYELNRALAPRRGTKCRLIFEPWTGTGIKPEDVREVEKPKDEGQAETPALPSAPLGVPPAPVSR